MPRVLRILNRLIIGGPSKNAVYLSRYMQPDFDTLLVIGGKEDHEQDADFLATANNIDPTCIPEMKRSISPYNDWAAYNKLKKLIDYKSTKLIQMKICEKYIIHKIISIIKN